MNDKKLGRVNEEIRRVLSDALLFGIKDPRIDNLSTVTEVRTTRDLKYTTVYIDVPGNGERDKEILEGLESAKGYLRKQIADKLNLRIVPELNIKIDRKLQEALKMSELIDKVRAEDKKKREEI